MDDQEREQKGFKVTDRRAFTPEGDLRETATSEPEAEDRVEFADAPSADALSPAPASSSSVSAPDRTDQPEDFRFLDLLSLIATQALVQLGEPNPATGESHTDLAGARVMISFLEVLKDKTQGNLSRDEARALDELLYDLRMRFVAKAKVAK